MTPPPIQPTATGAAPSIGRNLAGLGPFVGLALVLFLAGIVAMLLSGGTPGPSLRIFTTAWAQVGLFACAAALPLSVRSIDFSLAGTAAVCGLVFVVIGGVPGLLVGVVVALVVGVVNGALVGLLGLHPAVTTFGIGLGMSGLAIATFSPQGRTLEYPLPPLLGIAVLVLLIVGAVAVDAVTLANIRVTLPDVVRRASMHVIAAMLVGLAGILQVSTLRFASPNLASNQHLLLGFAAAVIGGTSAFGGWRSLVGAMLAAGFLTAVNQTQALLGVGGNLAWLVAAFVLLVGLGGDRLRAHLTAKRGPPT